MVEASPPRMTHQFPPQGLRRQHQWPLGGALGHRDKSNGSTSALSRPFTRGRSNAKKNQIVEGRSNGTGRAGPSYWNGAPRGGGRQASPSDYGLTPPISTRSSGGSSGATRRHICSCTARAGANHFVHRLEGEEAIFRPGEISGRSTGAGAEPPAGTRSKVVDERADREKRPSRLSFDSGDD